MNEDLHYRELCNLITLIYNQPRSIARACISLICDVKSVIYTLHDGHHKSSYQVLQCP